MRSQINIRCYDCHTLDFAFASREINIFVAVESKYLYAYHLYRVKKLARRIRIWNNAELDAPRENEVSLKHV